MCTINNSAGNLFGTELLALFDENNIGIMDNSCSQPIEEFETLDSIYGSILAMEALHMQPTDETIDNQQYNVHFDAQQLESATQQPPPAATVPIPDNHQFKVPQSFDCRYCPEKLFCSAAKRQHEISHIKKLLRCAYCRRRTKSVSEFRRHFGYYHLGKMMKHVYLN